MVDEWWMMPQLQSGFVAKAYEAGQAIAIKYID
jgi:hypothetical protein